MPQLRLNPWPFINDEIVELRWICSPRQIRDGQWRMEVAFLRSTGQIKWVIYPWGLLPYLRFGQKYSNGLPLDTQKLGLNDTVSIGAGASGSFCGGFKIPVELYSLYKNKNMGKECLWSFSAQGNQFYIPCVELVRAFFASNKMLANLVLVPHGLDLIIDNAAVSDAKVYMGFNEMVPKSVLDEKMLVLLVWLNWVVKDSWDNVYNNLFREAVRNNPGDPLAELRNGISIKIRPPVFQNTRWTYRGISEGNNILILELLGADGLSIPFRRINYSHPLIIDRKTLDVSKRRKIKEEDPESDHTLDGQDKSVKQNSSQEKIALPAMGLGFNRLPKVRAMPLAKSGRGVSVVFKTGKKGKTVIKEKKSIVGLDESVTGGEIKPIEFDSLDVVQGYTGQGLEEFYKAVEYIAETVKGASMSMGIINLPLGKKFSFCPEGPRRVCAVLFIKLPGSSPCWVLEVSRPDSWSVSTLLIKPMMDISPQTMEKIINGLLQSLVFKGGHWDVNDLSKYKSVMFEKMKHVKFQPPVRWGIRLLSKLS
ncbi:MAG: hypothetical protein ACOY46_05660 [Bacillota bacterium]